MRKKRGERAAFTDVAMTSQGIVCTLLKANPRHNKHMSLGVAVDTNIIANDTTLVIAFWLYHKIILLMETHRERVFVDGR